jgi:hypothetical protein
MTAVMFAGHRMLPRSEQYPLPPREIVDEVADKAGIEDKTSEETRLTATWISHFGYGAGMGALFGLTKDFIPCPENLKGSLFGLGVWAGSYVGWLPALNILKPVEEHPPRRTALMIAAHVVWGAALGLSDRYLEARDPERDPKRQL